VSSTRSSWHTALFGDLVANVNDYFDRDNGPESRVVAGANLSEMGLDITSWGLTSDHDFRPTFKRRFRAGDVLFHSRNTEKVGVPGFDGVTGEKIFVLRSKDEQRLLQTFLPWLMLAPASRAYIGRSLAGSVNKFLNWTPLARFEFDLPPIDEQREIAKLLWASERATRSLEPLEAALNAERRRIMLREFSRIRRDWPLERMAQLGDVQLGRQRAPKYMTGRYFRRYLRVVNVLDGRLDLRDVEEMDFDERDFERYCLRPGDLLVTEGDIVSPMNVGRCVVFRGEIEDCCFQNTLIRFRVGQRITPTFAQAALQDARHRGVLAAVASTTTVTHLGAKRFGTVEIPVPPPDVQHATVAKLETFDRALALLEGQRSRSGTLGRALRREMLEE
jgi:type I restriction enzyme, S subunit